MIISFMQLMRIAVSIVAVAVPHSSSRGPFNTRAAECDVSLWSHVYKPVRLTQIKKCVTATGTITESNADDDGDQHLLLKLDPGQEGLLHKKNLKKKDGALVIEIVCANPVKLKKVDGACDGYRNAIALPAVGSRVRVTGTYVVDRHNGWGEIHPVSKISAFR